MEFVGAIGQVVKDYGLVGVMALTMLGGVLVMRELIKIKRNGNGNGESQSNGVKHSRRWSDKADGGERLTLKDIRDSVHEMRNDTNSAILTLSREVAANRAQTKAEIEALNQRLEDFLRFGQASSRK